MVGLPSQYTHPTLTNAVPTSGSLNQHFQASVLLNNHLCMLMGMAKGYSDVIIESHDPQGPAGFPDHIGMLAMLCDSSG